MLSFSPDNEVAAHVKQFVSWNIKIAPLRISNQTINIIKLDKFKCVHAYLSV